MENFKIGDKVIACVNIPGLTNNSKKLITKGKIIKIKLNNPFPINIDTTDMPLNINEIYKLSKENS